MDKQIGSSVPVERRMVMLGGKVQELVSRGLKGVEETGVKWAKDEGVLEKGDYVEVFVRVLIEVKITRELD